MNKRQLLFVTYQDEHLDEGLSYAIELAKAMIEDIVLLLVQKKDTVKEKFEDLMAGVAFAEEGEHETARLIAAGADRNLPAEIHSKVTEMVLASSKAGVHLEVKDANQDVIAGIRSLVKSNPNIDKVVLSPAITESEVLTTRELNRLVRTASRPVVTMTRQSIERGKKNSHSHDEPSFGIEASVNY